MYVVACILDKIMTKEGDWVVHSIYEGLWYSSCIWT
jgi:hypothetical protein